MVRIMGENDLIKIELGCGKTKTDGFIGVDRFPLPGVDVVADMEKTLPFPDDYADIIYACHSLEHVDNFEHLIREIYRIARHGALIFILAPYCKTSLNEANFYHRTRFDENTFRFFTAEQEGPFALREYRCGHIVEWGLKGSDNSDCEVELTTLEMELFYFQEYRDLSPEEQTNARRALDNVCDQIYYLLAVNKENRFFSPEEKQALLQTGIRLAPQTIIEKRAALRLNDTPAGSILTDIRGWIEQGIAQSERRTFYEQEVLQQNVTQNFQAQMQQIQELKVKTTQDFQLQKVQLRELKVKTAQSFQSQKVQFQEMKVKIEQDLQSQKLRFQELKDKITQDFQLQEIQLQELKVKIEQNLQVKEEQIQEIKAKMLQDIALQEVQAQELRTQVEQKLLGIRESFLKEQQQQVAVTRSLAAHVLEQVASRAKKPPRRFFLGWPVGRGLFDTICLTNPTFAEGLILHDLGQHGYVPLAISNFLPIQTYVEYPIRGWGKTLNLFLFGMPGSRLFIEVVTNGAITHQEDLMIHGDGAYQIPISPVAEKAAVRLCIRDNCSLIRTLEVRKSFLFLSKRELACFVSH